MARTSGFDPTSGAYVDTRVARGFPLGGIGSGGFGFQSDGSFGEIRFNNNWMCPIASPRGAFFALWTRRDGTAQTTLLRRARDDEYANARPIVRTTFVGMLPGFSLRYDDDLPVGVTITGFTPHVPHDVRASTLPAALFRVTLANPHATPVEAAVLCSFENVLGRGGSGHLGVDLGPEQEMRGVRGRVVYDSVAGNWQEAVAVGARRGVRFRTDQRWDPRSHRAGVTGEYLLLAETGADLDVTVCDGWNADGDVATVLDDVARDGRLRSPASGMRGADGGWRPAAAVAATTVVPPGGTREVMFALAWWTPDHVTDPGLWRHRGSGPHDGVRVGHVYERHFASVDGVATHLLDECARLESASTEVGALLARSTLPPWLVRVVQNAVDSTLCNTVVPNDGTLYTLEGVDWHWPMGGLTGTNDQRLSACPYTATFFPELDLSELDAFRRLADARGAIPHGNGNCDLGLGTTDVPYGWPMFIKGFLPAKEWTDLTMSLVLQVGRWWRTTGRDDVRDRFLPALVRGMGYLDGLAPGGVPEGGTTYDVWEFPGAFAYTATLYLAALRTMAALGPPGETSPWRARYDACARRLEGDLWDARGFYKSCPDKDTLFTAALAGDWAARWAGLDPVVPPARAASHLRHQHRVLVRAAQEAAATRPALPWAEATFDGTLVAHPFRRGLPPGEEFTYVWQVVSYQACEEIYLGLVAEGLETLRVLYDRLWTDGAAWSGGLRGNSESIYMTHPVAWAILHALTGAALDVPGRALHLSPRLGGELSVLRCPVFFPGVWGWVEYDGSGPATFEVLRGFGAPPTVERVVVRSPEGDVRTVAIGEVVLRPGARIVLPS